MAAQHAQFAETIRAMKLALKRKADDSDSATSIHHPTNRGHKLQRRARFVRVGRLDSTGGLADRKQVTHAGYTRPIIAAKPTLYDEDGDVFASPPESSDEREVHPVEEDAFGSVRLEYLLRPLTRASELPDHPALSLGYKSTALTEMTEEALEMLRRERESLWKAKRLLLRFRGDADWVPCELLQGEGDEGMLLFDGKENEGAGGGGREGRSKAGSVGVERGGPEVEMEVGEGGGEIRMQLKADGGGMEGVQMLDMAAQQVLEAQDTVEDSVESAEGRQRRANHSDRPETNGDAAPTEEPLNDGERIDGGDRKSLDPTSTAPESAPLPTTEQEQQPPGDPEALSDHPSHSSKENNTANNNAPLHSMTTRARARSPIPSPSPSPTPSDSTSIPQINPWFAIPPTALPDRDLGLPPTEAEESRRLLLLYVQKQENIFRSLATLYEGLQRADRLRSHIYRSCKAEGHTRVDEGKGGMVVTEMSDGEDWYDVEDWGLRASDLKVGRNGVLGLEKGKDEADDVDEGEGRRVGGRRRRVARM